MIEHNYVQSSTVQSAGYDPESQELHIKFKDGGYYTYQGVPPEKYDAFMMSGSKGQFLHHQIKGKHEHAKL